MVHMPMIPVTLSGKIVNPWAAGANDPVMVRKKEEEEVEPLSFAT